MSNIRDTETSVQDEAARAGWLYYVGGMTQDQIASELGVSRQRAQRLVSRAMAEGLVHVRLEHPIAECIALEKELAKRFGLEHVRVAPSIGEGSDATRAIAPVAAALVERFLASIEPITVAVGTGRALRTTVEEIVPRQCAHHKLVSLIGNIAPDATASNYDVLMRLAEKTGAPHYPMPLPVIVPSPEVRAMFYELHQLQVVEMLAREADVTFVGVGQMNEHAPLYVDGFMTEDELREQQELGAVGEIASWVFDSDGKYLETGHNHRIGGLRAGLSKRGPVIGIAAGLEKAPAIRGALKGQLLNGLVTTDRTARAILSA
ncbi:MAG: sugar-binding transcriptional regulator [Paracoccaceae bacterium]